MKDHEIAAALRAATENEKAQFAQFLLNELASVGMDDHDAAKRQIVGALDRFALPEDRG